MMRLLPTFVLLLTLGSPADHAVMAVSCDDEFIWSDHGVACETPDERQDPRTCRRWHALSAPITVPPHPASSPLLAFEGRFPVTVDYDAPLAQVFASGENDHVDNDIVSQTGQFTTPSRGRADIDIMLFRLPDGKQPLLGDAMVSVMARNGFRPATVQEVLALGNQHPSLVYRFPIVALRPLWPHQPVRNWYNVAILSGYVSWNDWHSRDLSLYWYGDGWHPHFRFAFVKV